MLIECQECKKHISSEAASCPHCGYPVKKAAPAVVPASDGAASKKPSKEPTSPIFLALSVISLLMTFSTPMLLIFLPLMATMGFAAVSMLRKEKGRVLSGLVLLAGVGLWMAADYQKSSSLASTSSASGSSLEEEMNAVEIVDYNWVADPDFGTDGTIKWNVQVRNKSTKNIKIVSIEFTTYDANGKLVSTDTSYVNAVPAGEIRASDSYADLYGIEKTASAVIKEVQFAN